MGITIILKSENACVAVFKGTLSLTEGHVRCLVRRPSLIIKNMNIMTKEKFAKVINLPNPSSWYLAIRTRDVCRMLGKYRSDETPYSTDFLQSKMYSKIYANKILLIMLVGHVPGSFSVSSAS